MILCLDVGNSTIHGGVFDGNDLKLEFRRMSDGRSSSDELGVFLRAVLRENGLNWREISSVAFCSVVPDSVHSLRNSCLKYFDTTPFVLQAGTKTGLNIKYRNPLEVGSDRIANAIAVVGLYPGRNAVVVDFGTATTFEVVSANKDFLGGAILAGPRLSLEALGSRTAKLSPVEIVIAKKAIGRSTVENLQAGIYFGQIGMIKELTARITEEVFSDNPPIVVGTGGFANLFDSAGLFDVVIPDLVLRGLLLAERMNAEPSQPAERVGSGVRPRPT